MEKETPNFEMHSIVLFLAGGQKFLSYELSGMQHKSGGVELRVVAMMFMCTK